MDGFGSPIEPYGWIVYHHGHWIFDPELGWIWIPGYTWTPATVEWMYFDDYVGWAPLPPPGYRIPDPWDDSRWIIWNFVIINNFHQEYIGNYIVPSRFAKPIQKTKIVKGSPDIKRIESVTNLRIEKLPVQKRPAESEQKRYDKLYLPQKEVARIKKHAPEVEKKIIKPQTQKEIKPH